MNEASERPPEKVCDVDDCNAWKSGEYDFCHHHKGLQEGQAEAGNQRATKHGLYALPENLKAHFSQTQEDRYTAYFEALCTRYNQVHGQEPDALAKDRLSRVAIECVKERIADDYLAEKAKEGNVLVEDEVIGYDEESGKPQTVTQANKLLKELTALKRETRLTLKDMGLLMDPESQKAEAQEDLASLWASELRD